MRRSLLSVVVIVPVALWAGLAGAQSASSGQSSIHLSQAWARRAPMMGPAESGQGSMGSGHGSMGSGQSSMGSGQMHGQAGAAGNGAVYVLIENRGPEADALLGASSDAAKTVELHETRQEGGVMRMRPLAAVEVPAGGRIEMKPGGQHIMLLGLTRDLRPGDTVTVRVRFEKAGEQTVEAEVR
jgi:hypothetical protein